MSKKQSFWPYGIVIAFVVFCSFMIAFAIYSTRDKTELVASDYYQQEIAYQQVINGKKRLTSLGSKPILHVNDSGLQLELPAQLAAADSGQLRFYRPSDQSADIRFTWQTLAENDWKIDRALLISGPYQWVLQAYKGGDLYFHEQRIHIE
jgi:hypothetical protein